MRIRMLLTLNSYSTGEYPRHSKTAIVLKRLNSESSRVYGAIDSGMMSYLIFEKNYTKKITKP